jgi:hypothetical protein
LPSDKSCFHLRAGQGIFAEEKAGITRASYEFIPKSVYVRIECTDNHGKTAWSNPVFLDMA